MQATGQELPGLRVTVDKVVHHRDANFPAETPHAFVYFLTVSNLSQATVRLLGRKWIIRSPDGISVELLQKGAALMPAEPWASAPNVGSW